jgi:hypothetical protein
MKYAIIALTLCVATPAVSFAQIATTDRDATIQLTQQLAVQVATQQEIIRLTEIMVSVQQTQIDIRDTLRQLQAPVAAQPAIAGL